MKNSNLLFFLILFFFCSCGESWDCSNGNCEKLPGYNGNYESESSCLANCSGGNPSSGDGYNCVNGQICSYVSSNASYASLSSCENFCGASSNTDYGSINFSLSGIRIINQIPQCGSRQVIGTFSDSQTNAISVFGYGIQTNQVSFTSDYYTTYNTVGVSYTNHPYLKVDYRPNSNLADFKLYISTSGTGYWQNNTTYILQANVQEYARNGPPNYDYYLIGNVYTIYAELKYDYDALSNCF
ncbi:MAG: hypothetical protein R2836_05850 [Chitinophagales bacterium]